MVQTKYLGAAGALVAAGALAWFGLTLHAEPGNGNGNGNHKLRKVFVIGMENHNWTQPGGPGTGNPQQIFMNPAAPFINSLVSGTSGISDQVAYATNYLNAGLGIHPSEPNYVWAEAGDAGNSVGTDIDPYSPPPACTNNTSLSTDQHLSAFITKAHKVWRSYQEDANVDLTSNTPLPMSSWTVPLFSHSGNFSTGMNAYNYATQYNYATKHNPMAFFTDTNGGCPATPTTHYPPLQQLTLDLQNGTTADYNWITPNQFNDQHTRLSAGYGKFVPASDQSAVAQGDNFLARLVPLIMASQDYQNGAAIVLWWDESEGGDTNQFTLPFIIISRNAHANVGGLPFASNTQYSHSSFLRTMQEIFNVDPDNGFPFLGAAAGASDLSDLFVKNAIK